MRIVKEVALPQAGGVRYVRALFGGEALRFSQSLQQVGQDNVEQLMALQLSAYLCDEAGNATHTPEEMLDSINGVANPLYAVDMKRLLAAGESLNSIDDEALEEAAKK